MKILFMGTGEIGAPTLRWLAQSGHEILGVFTQPDRPAGRKSVMTPPPIKVLAEELGLQVFQPERLRNPDVQAEIGAMGADLIIVIAYGQILPKSVLEAPGIACWNLHASILPKYRGAAPIQAAILAGDHESGVTLMYMDEGLDTGDVLLIETLSLAKDETGGSLHDRLAELAPLALEKGIKALAQEAGAPRSPQDETLATHVGKLGREDGRIDWARSAVEIERMIRAYHPWPGTATSVLQGEGGGIGAATRPKKLKILPPSIVEEVAPHDSAPGSVLRADKSGLLVATGDERQALRVTRVQPESKKAMDVGAYLSGRPFGDGGRLQ
ncbi:MAG: methionyl-tRNA formyltransferase [Verrucomicrobiales bacterium]